MYKPLSDFLRECNAIPSNKLDTTVSQKNAKLSVLPFGTSTKLWIPLTDQRSEIRHFSVLISELTLSRISSRDDTYIESRGYYRKSHDSLLVMALWKPVERMLRNTERIPCDKVNLSAF
jgi:hypothetical protein